MVFLPMIDLSPSDPSCIFSTMLYVSDQALQHKKTAILTFDQPLYWKAYEIKAKKQANSDLKKMVLRLGGFHLRFVKERDPSGEFPSLRNIETGVTADSKVNVDSAKEVGERIIESMSGQSISTYSFKRSQQVVTLNSKNFMKIDEEPIFIDPQLLFQRFATVANSLDLDLSEVLTFELCSIPPALFDANGLPREA